MSGLNSFQLDQLNTVDLMRERLILEVNEQSERLIDFIKSNPNFEKDAYHRKYQCYKCDIRSIYSDLRIPTKSTSDDTCDLCIELLKNDWTFIKRIKYMTRSVADEAMLNSYGYAQSSIIGRISDRDYTGFRYQYKYSSSEFEEYKRELKNYKFKYAYLDKK